LHWSSAIWKEISVSDARWDAQDASVGVNHVNKNGISLTQAKFDVVVLEERIGRVQTCPQNCVSQLTLATQHSTNTTHHLTF
jgi:hypothetical protein